MIYIELQFIYILYFFFSEWFRIEFYLYNSIKRSFVIRRTKLALTINNFFFFWLYFMDENVWLHSDAIGRISKEEKKIIFSLPQRERSREEKKIQWIGNGSSGKWTIEWMDAHTNGITYTTFELRIWNVFRPLSLAFYRYSHTKLPFLFEFQLLWAEILYHYFFAIALYHLVRISLVFLYFFSLHNLLLQWQKSHQMRWNWGKCEKNDELKKKNCVC